MGELRSPPPEEIASAGSASEEIASAGSAPEENVGGGLPAGRSYTKEAAISGVQ